MKVATIILLACISFIAGCPKTVHDLYYYSVFISSGSGEDYDNNDIFSGGGGELAGEAIIYVNGNPISYLASGGFVKQLNPFLRKGENSISIKGDFSEPLYVKVAYSRSPGYENLTFVTKGIAQPIAENEEPWKMEFEADLPYTLSPYAPEKTLLVKKSEIRQQVLSKVETLYNHLSNHEGDKVAALMLEGASQWWSIANGKELPESLKMRSVQLYSDHENVFIPFEAENIKILYGENMVMAYSGFTESTDTPYLFSYRHKNELKYVYSVILAYCEGQWIVWWS